MPETHIGFTGTRHGMTAVQSFNVAIAMRGYNWLHHGDCMGADSEAHDIAVAARMKIEGHPPSHPRLRARQPCNKSNQPKPYLVRNHDIVDATQRLIAAPAEMTDQPRSGTWATIRYARKIGRPVFICFPDGSVSDE